MRGMTTTTTQAPWVNSATAKTTTTMAQTTAAMALTATPLRQCWSRCRQWWVTIPAPAMVKPVNTPMAYIGMSAATLAPVASKRAIDAPARQQDPVGEHQPVSSYRQLARQERVLGHEAHEERETR